MKIVEKSKFYMLISAAVMVAGIVVGVLSGGLNLGIDFTGGSIMTIDMKAEYGTEQVEKAFEAAGQPNVSVQKSSPGTGEAQTLAVVRVRPMENADAETELREKVMAEIQKTYAEATLSGVEHVGAVASAELIRNAFFSVAIAAVLILIYIAIRFELQSGIAAVIALLHDVLIMLAIVCITRLEINSSFIAAVLTIVGYSINNTIVVFDRVRDNLALYPKEDMPGIINRSIKDTFTRSMYTSLTTLITIGSLYILGTVAIRDFSLPIIVGLLAGTYSSLLIAGPLWSIFARGQRKNAPAKKRSGGAQV